MRQRPSVYNNLLSLPKWQIRIPEQDEKILIQSGHPIETALPNPFKVLLWNIQKALRGQSWHTDFLQIAPAKELLLLQEGHQVPWFLDATSRLPAFHWDFITSFIYQGTETGVVTGSLARPQKTAWLRSPHRELLLRSPKMTAIHEFQLTGSSQSLLVANIHGINFAPNTHLRAQIYQVLEWLTHHKGPILFAGDFNTWNPLRLRDLESACQGLGLQRVRFPIDPRRIPLDHIYFRGLHIKQSEILSHIVSSDHYPITIEFSI